MLNKYMKSERINVDLAKITRSAKPKKRERQHLVGIWAFQVLYYFGDSYIAYSISKSTTHLLKFQMFVIKFKKKNE